MEEKILELFLYNEKLKFNEIEKLLKTRSNKLSYHLRNLIKKNILSKEKDFYKLTETSEHIIPYLSNKKHVLSVLLVHIGNKNSCFLHKRTKKPYKDKLSLPGGRILLGETIEKATQRLMKEKFKITAKLKSIHSISLEHLKKKEEIIHSYLLIFVTATTEGKVSLTNIKNNKSIIICSDYQILKNDLNKEIKIKNISSKI